MGKQEEIRNALKLFIARAVPGGSMMAKVKAVDESNLTCTLVDDDDGLEYADVRLRPVLDGNEAVNIIPMINTWVIAEKIEDENDWIITSVSQASKVKIVTGTAVFEISASGIKIQNNAETLKAIIADLITAIKLITVNVTAVGAPTGVPINFAAFDSINARLNTLLL